MLKRACVCMDYWSTCVAGGLGGRAGGGGNQPLFIPGREKNRGIEKEMRAGGGVQGWGRQQNY